MPKGCEDVDAAQPPAVEPVPEGTPAQSAVTPAAAIPGQGGTRHVHLLAVKPDPVGYPPTGSSPWNVPNALTGLRLVLVIPFCWLLFGVGDPNAARYWGDPETWAALIFAVASITDFLDGFLARKYGLVTTFGKIADPIADKALTGAALIGLSHLHDLPWWVTIVILVREVGVTVLRFWVIRYGVIAASHGGKAKTVAQIIAIMLYLLPLSGIAVGIREVMMGIAVLLTVATGVDYLVRALKLRYRSAPAT